MSERVGEKGKEKREMMINSCSAISTCLSAWLWHRHYLVQHYIAIFKKAQAFGAISRLSLSGDINKLSGEGYYFG